MYKDKEKRKPDRNIYFMVFIFRFFSTIFEHRTRSKCFFRTILIFYKKSHINLLNEKYFRSKWLKLSYRSVMTAHVQHVFFRFVRNIFYISHNKPSSFFVYLNVFDSQIVF